MDNAGGYGGERMYDTIDEPQITSLLERRGGQATTHGAGPGRAPSRRKTWPRGTLPTSTISE